MDRIDLPLLCIGGLEKGQTQRPQGTETLKPLSPLGLGPRRDDSEGQHYYGDGPKGVRGKSK